MKTKLTVKNILQRKKQKERKKTTKAKSVKNRNYYNHKNKNKDNTKKILTSSINRALAKIQHHVQMVRLIHQKKNKKQEKTNKCQFDA